MRALLRLFSLRHLRVHALRGLLGLAAVMLGVALFVSSNVTITSVRASMQATARTLAGEAQWRVTRGRSLGVELALMDRIRTMTYVDARVRPGIDQESLRAQLANALAGRYSLFVYDKEQIRRVSDDVLLQTVAVADIQVTIAIVIGFLGIVNSQLISVLQRTREIGLIRAVGMTRRQVARMVVIEGVFIALVGGIIGVGGGVIGGWLPLRLFTFAITGYQYPLVMPWRHILLALAVAVLVGFLASIVPARRAARLRILDAIGYE